MAYGLRQAFLLSGFSIATLTAIGCQSKLARVDQVQPGMEKDLVLEQAGGPSVSRRWQGKDRWIYRDVSRQDEREVHFENGKAVYIGGKVLPKISAEEQDRINLARDVEEQKRLDAENAAANPGMTQEQNALFNESYYGIPAAPGAKPTKPRFESVE